MYNAFGEHKVFDSYGENTSANFIGNINPIRYRGYYFDTETGLYYLNSRYYDPEVGRFISPADISELNPKVIGGLNLYSYANNNPINFTANYIEPLSNNYSFVNKQVSLELPSFYDALGFASNLFAVLNGIKVAKYLTYSTMNINTLSVGTLLCKYSKLSSVADAFSTATAIIDGYNVYMDTGDLSQGLYTGLYDYGSTLASSKIGYVVGSFVGGYVGALLGTLVGLLISNELQKYKEDIVNWFDEWVG